MNCLRFLPGSLALALFTAGIAGAAEPPVKPSAAALEAEAKRIAVIEKVRPTVVAVSFYGGEACGSGVVIDEDGYAITNFHVVQPTGPILQCGLADGKIYDAVLVGQDKIGDVAMVKLLPKKPGDKFAFAKLGDSDKVKVGDWSLAMGNPFGLAADFTPSISFGIVSGVNRYQPPAAQGALEYTDCIQFDTTINPGNSGGPLFDMNGDLIGINGRGSFEKRGRVNSGVGYAISINQVKNFLGLLYAGVEADHATLGARVDLDKNSTVLGRLVFSEILDDADVFRRGLRFDDRLESFGGRSVTSINQYRNVLGIYPKDWRIPLVYSRSGDRKEILVRLMAFQESEGQQQPQGGGPPMQMRPGQAAAPQNKMFEARPGFTNYYFNKLRQEELLANLKKKSDCESVGGEWQLEGTIELADRKGDLKVTFTDAEDGKTTVKFNRSGVEDSVTPLMEKATEKEIILPTGSGGLAPSLYLYRRLLVMGRKGFEGAFEHRGHEPLYAPKEGPAPEKLSSLRVDCDVLHTKHAQFDSRWYFSKSDKNLAGVETRMNDGDPCEVFFSDYRDLEGKAMPHRIECHWSDRRYCVIHVKSIKMAPSKK